MCRQDQYSPCNLEGRKDGVGFLWTPRAKIHTLDDQPSSSAQCTRGQFEAGARGVFAGSTAQCCFHSLNSQPRTVQWLLICLQGPAPAFPLAPNGTADLSEAGAGAVPRRAQRLHPPVVHELPSPAFTVSCLQGTSPLGARLSRGRLPWHPPPATAAFCRGSGSCSPHD